MTDDILLEDEVSLDHGTVDIEVPRLIDEEDPQVLPTTAVPQMTTPPKEILPPAISTNIDLLTLPDLDPVSTILLHLEKKIDVFEIFHRVQIPIGPDARHSLIVMMIVDDHGNVHRPLEHEVLVSPQVQLTAENDQQHMIEDDEIQVRIQEVLPDGFRNCHLLFLNESVDGHTFSLVIEIFLYDGFHPVILDCALRNIIPR